MGSLELYNHSSDLLLRATGLLLLLMSTLSWVLIIARSYVLARARRSLAQSLDAFWATADLSAGQQALQQWDREALLRPLLQAALREEGPQSLAQQAGRTPQLTRLLRDALAQVCRRLSAGQVWLASIGATAPFVGLLGTVWGIYLALQDISAQGASGMDRIAGPVGEALVMTAAGLLVAIPAVLAYNLLGRRIGELEAELEGFAHDLLALLQSSPAPAA
ncbi:MotA/TolQ/ExbB proton channel family protein [Roseateles sp. BYS180W]|uniref:Biopolymer transport protein ExbB n=1 Tax=Roseateles rivi TaxID=3299028 RepID=A0ABW7FUH4_9BURK